MITQRTRGLYTLLVALQILFVTLAYWGHFFLIVTLYSEAAARERYWIYYFLVIMALVIHALYHVENRAGPISRGFFAQHRTVLGQTLTAATVIALFLVASKDQIISRVFLFSFSFILYAVLFLTNALLPPILRRLTFTRRRQEVTLLVGSGSRATALKNWLESKSELGIEAIGILCEETQVTPPGFPVLGGLKDFARVIEQRDVTLVILVELPLYSILLTQMVAACEKQGVRLLVTSDLEERFRHAVTYIEDEGFHFFALRDEPLENPVNRLLKRTLDIVVSFFVVTLVLPPTMILVWLLQRRQSKGPLFYRQSRTGFHGRPFEILKYRTMHVSDGAATAQQATLHDQRVYRAGFWLRKMSIDEFPQFWNVLKGEMSVVGPRPHLLEHNEKFAELMKNYHIRSIIKPGITGLAQVKGYRGETRTEEALHQRVHWDIHYLENWSLALDLWIIMRTAWQMIRPPVTAY